MAPTSACTQCGFANPQGSIFCSGCGQSTVATIAQELSEEGQVDAGVWDRGKGEFVTSVAMSDMKSSLMRSYVQVPADSVGVIVLDGKVKEVVSPGLRLSAGIFDKLGKFFSNLIGRESELDRSTFYLVAVSPILFPPMMVTAPAGDGTEVQVQTVVQGVLPNKDDMEGLGRFFQNVVGASKSVGRKDLVTQLRPKVDKAVQDAIARHGDDYAAGEAMVTASLKTSLGETTGFDFRVELTPKGTTVSMETILGLYEMPEQVPCTNWNCEHQIMPTEGICSFCGEKQEGRDLSPTKEKLYTSDGVDVEVHAIIRAQGQGNLTQGGMVTGALNSAAANAIRNVSFEELTKGGLKKINAALTATAREVVENLGFRLLGIQLIDVRSVQSDWLLDARNQLTKARQQIELDTEWADVNKDEIDLQAVVFGNMLLRAEVDANHKFDMLKLELHDDFRRLKESNKYGLMTADEMFNHDFQMDDMAMQDLERRQDHKNRQSDLDIADAQREAVTDVKVDQSLRARDRILAQEDHTDVKSDVERERDLRSMMREDENSEISHQFGQEKAVAQHADDITRQGMQLDSDKRRLGTDDRSHEARSMTDDADYAANKSIDQEHRQDDLNIDRESRRQQLKMEKLKGMADIEASMADRENSQEALMKDKEASGKLERMQAGQNMGAEQIMAMAAMEGRELTDAEAQAMAAIGSGADKAKAEAAEKAKEEQMALMTQMMQMNQQQSATKDAGMMEMMKQMMASQQAVTQSAVEGAASAGMATGQAYKDSASQAGHSATQAMQSMSHVAGNQAIGNSGIQASKPSEIPKSSDAPQAEGPPVCKKCGTQAIMGARFCSKGCGALG
jgi:hypothetical protein